MSQTAATENHPETTAYNPPPRLDEAIRAVPLVEAERVPKKIGYLTNYSFHIWYQIVIEILKRRGAQYGAEIVIKDANLSVESQIAQAREMITEVDALILTPAATEGLEEILQMAEKAGKTVVVEANPVEGMSTMIAICDYDAGYDLGVWVGENVKKDDGSPLRILDVGLPTLRPCLLRSEGFAEGVKSVQPDAVVVASINGEATPSIARKIALETLKETGDVDVIFAMDDETGQGAFQGYVDAGFDPETVTVAGFGLAGEHEKEWLLRREALKVSAAMFPEYVSLRCLDAVIKLYNGQEVSVRDVIPTVPMTAEMLEKFYPEKDGVWTPDFAAIAALPAKGDCTKV
ncbi:MAG TPA: sugar ABC transporter substrate-binding protein [Pyrinomonadaceae bacterium]|nr:sugar ABC transporter substrate-binding protein [Pyrinomonadaceae bacterium]